jgi:cell wall assembly regulator SMI1
MLQLGANDSAIQSAEAALGVTFPDRLREFYRTSNGIELPPDWRVHAVFDPEQSRKSAINIVQENTSGRWDSMSKELLSIACNATGNQLVMKRAGETLDEQIFLWNHETRKLRPWTRDLAFLLTSARKRVAEIEKRIEKGQKRSQGR